MPAKFDSEMLKKHHFWFLLVVVLIGLALAWIGLFWDVPAETLKTAEEQEGKQKTLKGVQPKPRLLIAKYSDQGKELEARRVNMWKQAWNEQKHLYFWPTKRPAADNNPFAVVDPERAFFLDEPTHGFTEKQLAVVANRKFGEDIPNKDAVREQFPNPQIYKAAYEKLIADLEPMQFRDKWQNMLKYVSDWKPQIIASEEIWLAMEDLWVQREMLMRIHQVNLEAAKFASTSDIAGQVVGAAGGSLIEKPNQRVFRSRLWRLDIQLVDENNKRVLKGSLTNATDRLQVLGIGNVLKLKVWTNDPEKARHYPFEIEGVSVPARKTLPIKFIAGHELPSEWTAKGIFKVEQVFDARTVPVKRIEYLEIGKLSDRNNSLPLRFSTFTEKIAKSETPTNTGGPGGSPMETGQGLASPSPMGGDAGPTGEGVGPPVLNAMTAQHQINRLRYIDVTEQLRRIPIGVVIVTDQTYKKDIVESIANTKMRFQTTQVESLRFHNTLFYNTIPSSTRPPMLGEGGDGEEGRVGPFIPMFGSGYSSGGPENSSQDQYSANLMELSVYGIISLYEKYEEPKDGAPKVPGPTPAVKDDEPAPPAKEKDKDPAPPMPKDKMPPAKEPDPKVPNPKEKGPPPKEAAPMPPAKPKP